MKKFIFKNSKAIAGIAAILLVGAITMSFQDSPFVNQRFEQERVCNDTLPDKHLEHSMKMKEFDKMIELMDRDLLKVDGELRKIDLEKIQQQIELSLKEIDIDKIMKEATAALKTVDMDKIMEEVKQALKEAKFEINSTSLTESLEQAKLELAAAQKEMKSIDLEFMKKEMEKAKLELEKSRIEIRNIDIDKIMETAKAGIDKAKIELKLIKAMFNEMENEGLINSKDGFSIEYKDRVLYINGKQQSEKTTERYKKYFKEDHFKISIEKD